MLSGSVSNGTTVCHGDVVIFNCTTNESEILIWHLQSQSMTVQDLEFVAGFSVVGDTLTRTGNISATLNSVTTTSDGNTIIVSTLSIPITVDNLTDLSVTCHNEGEYINKTVTFNVNEGKYCTC